MVTQQVQAADSTWFIPIPRDQDERSLDSGQPFNVLEFFVLSRWRLEVRFDHGATPRRQDDVGTFDGWARAVRQPRETPPFPEAAATALDSVIDVLYFLCTTSNTYLTMPITSGAPAHGNPAHLLPPSWTSVISAWLAEDTPSFDYGGFVVGAAPATARLLAKSPGILAGVPFVEEIFKQLDCKVEWLVKEGDLVGQNGKQHVATVSGPTRNLLLGERVALNVIARCSGIATKCVFSSSTPTANKIY
jgi:hypothetical protein